MEREIVTDQDGKEDDHDSGKAAQAGDEEDGRHPGQGSPARSGYVHSRTLADSSENIHELLASGFRIRYLSADNHIRG